MTNQSELREAMQIEVGSAEQPGNPALDYIEADVRFLGDREDLGSRGSRQEERHMGKRGDVMPTKPACIAAGNGRGSQRRKRKGRTDDAHVEPPEVVLWEIGRFALLLNQLGFFVEVRRRRQPIEKRRFLPERRRDLGPAHAAEVAILLVALKAVFFTVIGVFLGQNPESVGVEDASDRLGVASRVGHSTSPYSRLTERPMRTK